MTIEEHADEFAGLPVRDYDPEAGVDNPSGTIYRLSLDWEAEEPITGLFARFLEEPDVGQSRGIVIGAWQGDDSEASSDSIVEALVAAREQLPDLRALFLGDITSEENEISWIQQSDVTALFDAYPGLEHFRVRGGNGLVIGRLRHENLRSLIVETGGLDAEVVRGIAECYLPNLDHLELWLGTAGYGRTVTIEDLEPILLGDKFPALRRLGLRNCEGADAIARKVATAPLLSRLEVLDLGGTRARGESRRGPPEGARHPPPLRLGRGDPQAGSPRDQGQLGRPPEAPRLGSRRAPSIHRRLGVSRWQVDRHSAS
jgi:hypothetical protein